MKTYFYWQWKLAIAMMRSNLAQNIIGAPYIQTRDRYLDEAEDDPAVIFHFKNVEDEYELDDFDEEYNATVNELYIPCDSALTLRKEVGDWGEILLFYSDGDAASVLEEAEDIIQQAIISGCIDGLDELTAAFDNAGLLRQGPVNQCIWHCIFPGLKDLRHSKEDLQILKDKYGKDTIQFIYILLYEELFDKLLSEFINDTGDKMVSLRDRFIDEIALGKTRAMRHLNLSSGTRFIDLYKKDESSTRIDVVMDFTDALQHQDMVEIELLTESFMTWTKEKNYENKWFDIKCKNYL